MKSTNPNITLAIIPDGNRRAAKRLMQQPWKGHEWGLEKTKEVLRWCRELNIREVTFYAFSLKNFNRPKKEFDFLMQLFKNGLDQLKIDDDVKNNKIKVNFIGRLHLFDKELQEKMQEISELTKHHTKHIINFAIGYDCRAEIVDAVKKIAKDVKEGKIDLKDIDEALIQKNLYLSRDVDLVIRTSGEKRTSSFLPLQADYAELAFIQSYWPEVTKEEFVSIIEDFKKRDRRFGK